MKYFYLIIIFYLFGCNTATKQVHYEDADYELAINLDELEIEAANLGE